MIIISIWFQRNFLVCHIFNCRWQFQLSNSFENEYERINLVNSSPLLKIQSSNYQKGNKATEKANSLYFPKLYKSKKTTVQIETSLNHYKKTLTKVNRIVIQLYDNTGHTPFCNRLWRIINCFQQHFKLSTQSCSVSTIVQNVSTMAKLFNNGK